MYVLICQHGYGYQIVPVYTNLDDVKKTKGVKVNGAGGASTPTGPKQLLYPPR